MAQRPFGPPTPQPLVGRRVTLRCAPPCAAEALDGRSVVAGFCEQSVFDTLLAKGLKASLDRVRTDERLADSNLACLPAWRRSSAACALVKRSIRFRGGAIRRLGKGLARSRIQSYMCRDGRSSRQPPPSAILTSGAPHPDRAALRHARGKRSPSTEPTFKPCSPTRQAKCASARRSPSVEQDAYGVTARGADGIEERGDVLVGADGLDFLTTPRGLLSEGAPRKA